MILKGAGSKLVYYSAPFRRFGATYLGRLIVLAIGLGAVTAFTMPDLAKSSARHWLTACLWCCLGYFAAEGGRRAWGAIQAGHGRSHLRSASGIIDILAVFPVPLALMYGVPPPTAWLLATLWVLKLAEGSPGFAQLGRVFVLAT